MHHFGLFRARRGRHIPFLHKRITTQKVALFATPRSSSGGVYQSCTAPTARPPCKPTPRGKAKGTVPLAHPHRCSRAVTLYAITKKSITSADHTAPQSHVDVPMNQSHRSMNCVRTTHCTTRVLPPRKRRKNLIFSPLDLTSRDAWAFHGNEKYLEILLPLRSWHRQGRPPVQKPAPMHLNPGHDLDHNQH